MLIDLNVILEQVESLESRLDARGGSADDKLRALDEENAFLKSKVASQKGACSTWHK
jgi:hypothetical protein